MSDESTEFRLVVENSLLSHVQGELDRMDLDFDARVALHHYLTAILNNCPYPIAADTGLLKQFSYGRAIEI